MMSFILNAFALRFLSREIVGIFNVRLVLLYSTLSFLAKEAFRKALIGMKGYSLSQIYNTSWLSVPLSIILAFPLAYIWLYLMPQPVGDVEYTKVIQ